MIPTPEQVEAALTSPSLDERGLAEGVKAACERLTIMADLAGRAVVSAGGAGQGD